MNSYEITYVLSRSQHRNATKETKTAQIKAATAQDAVYIITVNEAAGGQLFFTVINIKTL